MFKNTIDYKSPYQKVNGQNKQFPLLIFLYLFIFFLSSFNLKCKNFYNLLKDIEKVFY